MENVSAEWDNLNRIIQMIAGQFGSKCEVVLHDLTLDYDHTIVSIQNSHITGRNIGDSGSNLGLEVLRGTVKDGDSYGYITKTKSGSLLRSSTVFLKNNEGSVIGSICVNFDITEFQQMEQSIKGFIGLDEPIVDEIFANDVGELLDYFIAESQKIVNKQPKDMTREDKIRIIEFIDKKGAFLIMKAGDKICEYLNISKFTLYNYLDIAKKNCQNSADASKSE